MANELTQKIKNNLIEKASELGFNAINFTKPNYIPKAKERLYSFLQYNYNGDMDWMAKNADRRADPAVLWDSVQTIIMLGINYNHIDSPLTRYKNIDRGVISVYALNEDYHDIIKKKLKRLAGFIYRNYGSEVKVFVDTAPVMEKPLAESSGLGWQGKHTNLVSNSFGSWLLLGSIFTTLDLPADISGRNHCGSCQSCLDICPTKAFPKPYILDARRCISYLTIEYKGNIDKEFRGLIGNRIYGCDDCIAVCPWNKFAKESTEMKLKPREELLEPKLSELVTLTDTKFRELFRKSPVKRIGRERFIRNVLIAIGNSGNKEYLQQVVPLLNDASSIVRGMAVWACFKISDKKEFKELQKKYLYKETNPNVCVEWHSY